MASTICANQANDNDHLSQVPPLLQRNMALQPEHVCFHKPTAQLLAYVFAPQFTVKHGHVQTVKTGLHPTGVLHECHSKLLLPTCMQDNHTHLGQEHQHLKVHKHPHEEYPVLPAAVAAVHRIVSDDQPQSADGDEDGHHSPDAAPPP